MQLTFGEVLGLIGTLTSIITGIAVMIYRFTKLEGRVGRVEERVLRLEEKVVRIEEKVDQILAYLAPRFKGKKMKQFSRKH